MRLSHSFAGLLVWAACTLPAFAEAPEAAEAIELVKQADAAFLAGDEEKAFAFYGEEEFRGFEAFNKEWAKLTESIRKNPKFKSEVPDSVRKALAPESTREAFLLAANMMTGSSPQTVLGTFTEGETTYVAVARELRSFDLVPIRKTPAGELRRGLSVLDRRNLKLNLQGLRLLEKSLRSPDDEASSELENLYEDPAPVEPKVLAIFANPKRESTEPKVFLVRRDKRVADGVEESYLDVTPLFGRESLHALLDGEDPAKLDDERRAKLEAAILESARQAEAEDETEP